MPPPTDWHGANGCSPRTAVHCFPACSAINPNLSANPLMTYGGSVKSTALEPTQNRMGFQLSSQVPLRNTKKPPKRKACNIKLWWLMQSSRDQEHLFKTEELLEIPAFVNDTLENYGNISLAPFIYSLQSVTLSLLITSLCTAHIGSGPTKAMPEEINWRSCWQMLNQKQLRPSYH